MALSFIGEDPDAKLVGRAPELLNIAKVLASARAGSAGAVIVLGEPGIGKTRMLDELCEQAAAGGFDVLAGRGSEFEREVPYSLVVDSLDERFRVLAAEIIASLGKDRLAELAAVLPSLSGRGGPLASRLEVERFEFHRAVRATFEQLVRRRPVLLALDDVHWADPASVELIGFLLRRAVPGMVLALAYRARQAPRLLLAAVQQARRDGLLRELDLAPLTIGEAADLLGQQPGSALVRSLHAESGGNPFYIEQLARMAHEPAAPTPRAWIGGKPETGIPAAVRAALAQELANLPFQTLEVLQAAAVAGDPFDVDLVAEIVATDKTLLLERIDSLAAADLVRATDVAGWLRFRHPIVRRVVYDSAMPGWRFGAHKRAARALARRDAPLGVQAHHVEHSASAGDDEAVAILTDAGQAAEARAPAAAAGWFEAALRLLPETSRSERRLPLMISLAGALAAAGRLRDSRTVLERTLEFLPADSLEDRVRIIGMIVRADHGLGRAEEAHHLLTTALEQAAPGSPNAVALRLNLAENHLMMGQGAQAVETAAAARAQARALGDPTLLLAATSKLAVFTSHQGTVAETLELIDWAAGGMDARGVELTPTLLEALDDLVYTELSTDRFRDACRHAERGLHVSRTTGHGYLYVRFTLGVAGAKLWLGQLYDAKSAAESAVEAAVLLDNDQLLSNAEGVLCWIETLRGDLPAALAAGRASVRATDRQPNALFAWIGHVSYGEALIEAGEVERGRREIMSIGGPELSDLPPTPRALWCQALVTAELSAGRIEAAETVARRMADAAPGLASSAGNARHAQARISLVAGNFQKAAGFAHEAVQCFDALEMRVWAGRARLVAGRAHALAGEHAAAVRELELAHGILDDAGAERLRDEAAKELRTLGRRVRRKPTADEPTGAPILTEREQSIADRVVQGLTNREIATELFVSPKTVEKHLARIFAKLGISSRAGVATALNRRHTGAR
ncbi:AAA family ATPase [Nocardia sp. NBC_01730]|uniref:helix-turn-helix transcriptional regulator n=1 Tax=Nocardia sp. NBC_01730 TaxID=2975998 RepID=UPI002E1639D8|nr:AAA family ATPase [Nocardia sp. NBC_01730]